MDSSSLEVFSARLDLEPDEVEGVPAMAEGLKLGAFKVASIPDHSMTLFSSL